MKKIDERVEALMNIIKQNFDQGAKELKSEVSKCLTDYSKDVQNIITEFVIDYKKYKQDKITTEQYNNILKLRQRAIQDLIKGGTENSINLILKWLKEFLNWAWPIALKALLTTVEKENKKRGI
jgi:hypothetical protein